MTCRYKNIALPIAFAAASIGITGTIAAKAPVLAAANAATSGQELPPYLQCVPYARDVSGIDIYGDAHTWWDQAAGRFERGHTPRVGAVMAFEPHRNMQLGHVAAVSRVIDSRTVLLDHANWSPIDGRRGQIERNVKAVDVSPGNDWSQVRVWYHPLHALGVTQWPVSGFIYADGTPRAQPRRQFAQVTPQPTREEPSRTFLAAFNNTPSVPSPARTSTRQTQPSVTRANYAPAPRLQPRRTSADTRGNSGRDVAERAVALYD